MEKPNGKQKAHWQWFDALSNGTESSCVEALRRLTQPGILSSICREAIRDGESERLDAAWEVCATELSELVDYYFETNPSTQNRSIDSARITRAILGTLSSARLVLAFPRGEPARLERLLREGCASWSGRELGALSELGSSSFSTYAEPTSLDDHFDVLRRRSAGTWPIAQARECVHVLLESRREPICRVRVPVLGYYDPAGFSDVLWVEVLAGGSGECIADTPLEFAAMDEDFVESTRVAWEEAKRLTSSGELDVDVRWRTSQSDAPLTGGSMGVALGVAFTQALRGVVVDPGCALTGTICEGGEVGFVHHVEAKVEAGLRSQYPEITRVIVCPSNKADAVRAVERVGRDSSQVVQVASTLEEACEHASGLLQELLSYFEKVEEFPDREALPDYFGGRPRTGLFVEPKVRMADIGQSERAQREAGEQRWFDDEDAVSRTVTWSEAWEMMDRARSRSVVLAAAGRGKSLLARMTARRIAGEERADLGGQGVSLDGVRLPIVVTSKSLAESPLDDEEALRDRIASALVTEGGCSEDAARYLAEHAHQERCWLILDALDEASGPGLDRLFELLARGDWKCRVLIMSRPSGYQRQTFPFGLDEYRLADFDGGQVAEFLRRWEATGNSEGESSLANLLASSGSLRRISACPFLLTLLCWENERHPLDTGITRNWLYERMLRDILGLPSSGRGAVDERRAAEWLPLLGEVALASFEKDAAQRSLSVDRLLNIFERSEFRPRPLDESAREVSRRQQASDLLDELERKRLLVPSDASKAEYAFPHRSAIEFLCGYSLAESVNSRSPSASATWDRVNRLSWHPDWQDSLTFFAGRLVDPEPWFSMLMGGEDDLSRSRLRLAILALGELDDERLAEYREWIDRLTTEGIGCWLAHHLGNTSALLIGFEDALSVVARVNGRVEESKAVPHHPGTALRFLDYLVQLLQDSKPKVRCSATTTVGLLGREAVTPELFGRLARLLGDSNAEVRASAVRRVRDLGSGVVTREMWEQLARLLEDPDSRVRISGTSAVTLVDPATAPPEFVARLARLMDSREPGVKSAAAEAVFALGPTATSPLVLEGLERLLADSEFVVRSSAVKAVWALGDSAATPEFVAGLARLLDSPEASVRSSSAKAVGYLGNRAATPELLAKLRQLSNDADFGVGASAFRALEALDESEADLEALGVRSLRLEDFNPCVRRVALRAVETLGSAAATPAFLELLARLLAGHDSGRRYSALQALGYLGSAGATPAILAQLERLLSDSALEVGLGAARVLASLGPSAATPPLLAQLEHLLADDDSAVRATATKAVYFLGRSAVTPEMLERLERLLEDDVVDVRYWAARAVGFLGDEAATPTVLERLAGRLEDPILWMRPAAAGVVGTVGSRAAIGPILDRLVRQFHDSDPSVRVRAVWAVGALGAKAATPEILEGLGRLLEEPRDWVRAEVVKALRSLGAGAGTPEILEGLTRLAETPTPWLGPMAAELLGTLAEGSALAGCLERFARNLEDADVGVSCSAARAVEALGSRAATPSILERLERLLKNPETAARAARSLCTLLTVSNQKLFAGGDVKSVEELTAPRKD